MFTTAAIHFYKAKAKQSFEDVFVYTRITETEDFSQFLLRIKRDHVAETWTYELHFEGHIS